MAAPVVTTTVLSLTNYCFDRSTTVTSDISWPGYPVENVLKQDRSKKWRTYKYTGYFIIDFHIGKHPEVFGLIESNFGTSAMFDSRATITLTAADDLAITQNTVQWQWATQSNNSNKTWVKVLGDPDSGTWSDTTTKRFWKVNIQLSDQDYIFQPEVGVVWLGDFYQIPLESNFGIKVVDSGREGESYNGSVYLDSLRAYSEVSVSIPVLYEDTALILKSKLDTIGGSRNILIDIYSPDSTSGRSLGTYYGLLDEKNTATFSYKTNKVVELKIKVTESLS